MISLALNDAAAVVFQRLGLPCDAAPLWWGVLPALERADSEFEIFAPERRARLADLSRHGCNNPASLNARDFAFYCGLLAEAGAVINAGVRA